MCSFVKHVAILAATLAASTALAFQDGPGSSGGGNAVILPDDTVVLADPFYRGRETESLHCGMATRGTFSDALKEEIERAGMLLVRYGAATTLKRSEERFLDLGEDFYTILDSAKFIAEQVLNPRIEYCFVEALPKQTECPEQSALPEGATCEAIAYTEVGATWIKEARFRQMSVREQAKLIIHERLHAFAGNAPHQAIRDFTDGLETVLFLYHFQMMGIKQALTDDQITSIRTLMSRIRDLRLHEGETARTVNGTTNAGLVALTDYFSIARNGGGLVGYAARIDDSAFISVGSFVPTNIKVGAGTVILNSRICPTMTYFYDHQTLDEDTAKRLGTKPGRLDVRDYEIGAETFVEHSNIINCGRTLKIGAKASIYKSNIALFWHSFDFEVGDGAQIIESELKRPLLVSIGDRASLVGTRLVAKGNPPHANSATANFRLVMGDDSGLKGLTLDDFNAYDDSGFFGWGSSLPTISLAAEKKLDVTGWSYCANPNLAGELKASYRKSFRDMCPRLRTPAL